MKKTHGQDFQKRFPPSWKYREIVILDRTKPIPEELKIVDMRRENAKKRYHLRYALEDEYRDKDIDRQELEKYRALNRIEKKKFFDEKQKGFDLITLNQYKDDEVQPKSVFQSQWDKLQLNSNNYPSTAVSRQQSGIYNQTETATDFRKNSEKILSRHDSEMPRIASNIISRKESQSQCDNQPGFKIKTVGFNQK